MCLCIDISLLIINLLFIVVAVALVSVVKLPVSLWQMHMFRPEPLAFILFHEAQHHITANKCMIFLTSLMYSKSWSEKHMLFSLSPEMGSIVLRYLPDPK